MQLGLVGYVRETERNIRRALAASRSAIRKARRSADADNPLVEHMLNEVEAVTNEAQEQLETGASRWAQGTIQVMLRENPLVQRGLSWGQRLMYFATMWTYLSGFAAVVYFAAPIVYLAFGVLPVSSLSTDFFIRFIPFMLANQLLFWVAGRGIKTWRGQQYSLALFPTWIKACTTAARNVWFGRPLGFAVTPKARQSGGPGWSLIRPQIVVSALLVVALIIGVARLAAGLLEPVGTLVNVVWVAFDLVVMSVLFRAVRYKGFIPEERNADAV